MKKLFALALALLSLCTPALAEIDLSGMSYDELVALKDQINLAMWTCQEWQEVTVPQGVWEVGVDIPEGHWTIIPAEGAFVWVKYGSVLDESGKDLDYSRDKVSVSIYSPSSYGFDPNSDRTSIDIEASSGHFFIIDYGSAIFTPYSGKPSLNFK